MLGRAVRTTAQTTVRRAHKTFRPLDSMSSEPMAQRVKKVFGDPGSREASRREALANGITVAGVHIPARPDPPTNCCQNGCTECVWVLFKDEFLDFQRKKREAKRRLCLPEYRSVAWPALLGPEPASRAGASTSAQPDPEPAPEDENEGLDHGLRVFVETEKRINARHKKQQAVHAAATADSLE